MLRHSADSEPGYTRQKKTHGERVTWAYFDPDGKRVTDRAEIDRLNALALPPAYREAWFCRDDNGHIQATGVDARGRKQYRYHADYRARKDAAKYDGCREFGEALPKLRARVERDLKRPALDRDAVLAAVVRLLDDQHIRIGNEQYARDNKSFGATTLRTRHLRTTGGKMTMRFTGKHGIVHQVTITDRNLKRVVRHCQDLPGQNLFQYLGDDGEPHPISSADVNAYIKQSSGGDFTAKHFRTWGASVIFFDQLLASDEQKLTLKTVLEPVAEALGNTLAISRKSYVHPCLIDALQADPVDPLHGMKRPRPRTRLSSAEAGFLAFLRNKPRRARRRRPAANDTGNDSGNDSGKVSGKDTGNDTGNDTGKRVARSIGKAA